MAITITLDKHAFVEMFSDYGRGDNFSREAREVLFDYYDEFDNFEMDVIAICCEWSESSWQEIANDYRIDLTDCEDDDERIEAVRDYLSDNTSYMELSDGETFVYQSF